MVPSGIPVTFFVRSASSFFFAFSFSFRCAVIFIGRQLGIYAMSVEFVAFQCSDDFLSAAFFHIEKRVGRQQVYTSYVYTPRYEGVDHFDEVGWEKSVSLSQVDIYTFESGFGRANVFFTSVTSFLRKITLFGFASVFVGDIQIGGVAVIINEPVKFERYDSLDEVLFGEPPQFSGDVRQVFGDLFFVYLYFFDTVGEVEELFFADLFSGGNHSPLEFFADNLFDGTHFPFFTTVHDETPDFPALPVRPLRCV